jgi:hypothetical protein
VNRPSGLRAAWKTTNLVASRTSTFANADTRRPNEWRRENRPTNYCIEVSFRDRPESNSRGSNLLECRFSLKNSS